MFRRQVNTGSHVQTLTAAGANAESGWLRRINVYKRLNNDRYKLSHVGLAMAQHGLRFPDANEQLQNAEAVRDVVFK